MNCFKVVFLFLVLNISYGYAETLSDEGFATYFEFPITLYLDEVVPLAVRAPSGEFYGTEVGNGGFLIECNKPTPKAAFFYDYLLFLNSLSGSDAFYFTSTEGVSTNEIVERWISRYAEIDGISAFRLNQYFKEFWSKVIWIEKNDPLEHLFVRAFEPIDHLIDDLLNKDLKYSDCQVKQMISYVAKGNDYYYAIRKEAYERLDNQNRAAAILHELFYHELNKLGKSKSWSAARFMEAMMGYLKLEYIGREFIQGVKASNLRARKAAGLSFAQFEDYLVQLNSFDGVEPVVPEDKLYHFWAGLYDPFHLKSSFTPYPHLQEAYLFPTEVKTRVRNKLITLKVGGPSTFWPTGKIKESQLLSGDVELKFLDRRLQCSQALYFNSQGKVSGCK